MYLSARYELPANLAFLSRSASANIVRFQVPIGASETLTIALLDTNTGVLTEHAWVGMFETMPLAQSHVLAVRADQKHLLDVPPTTTVVRQLVNIAARASPTQADRKRKDTDDLTGPPTAFLREKSKMAT
jgi:hypothetical protein